MLFSLSAAAKAVGKGKSTLHNAIRSGRLSATRNADGTYSIDASELARVYELNVVNPSDRPALDAGEPPSEPPGTELAVLRTKAAMLEDQLARERETCRETVDDLRKRLDQEQEERRNLQRQLAPPIQPSPEAESHIRPMATMAPPAPQMLQERPAEPSAGATPASRVRAILGRLWGP